MAKGELYTAFIENELKAERDRRSSLDARGAALITTSTGLVGLVAALSALALGKDFRVTGVAAWLLVGALVAFLGSGILGVSTSFGRWYKVADTTTLQMMVTAPHWSDGDFTARLICATANARTIASIRIGNNKKASLLTWGQSLQLIAVAALATAVGVELFRRLVQ